MDIFARVMVRYTLDDNSFRGKKMNESFPLIDFPVNRIDHSELCNKCWRGINYLDIRPSEEAIPVLVAVEMAPRDQAWQWHECRINTRKE